MFQSPPLVAVDVFVEAEPVERLEERDPLVLTDAQWFAYTVVLQRETYWLREVLHVAVGELARAREQRATLRRTIADQCDQLRRFFGGPA